MKLKSVQKVMGGILGAAVLLGIPSCSDDHFDIKTQGAGNTIWQNIEANPELEDVAKILKEVKVYTKLEDKKRSMTYAELLNQPQSFTFFAPVNGSFDANYYLSKIEEIKTKRANGETAADTLEYNLGVQFAQNHLARFNFESVKGEQSLRLYNGKLATFNATEGLFNGVKLNADLTNIASSNGMLHCLDGVSPFAYNVYEYMGAAKYEHGDSLKHSDVYNILNDPSINKKIFNEGLSTPGGMNSEGNMVYIDSVYTYNNELIDNCGAQIKNEDSMYVAVIPTNAAWRQAVAKVKKLFNYANLYRYNYKGGNTPSQAFQTRYDLPKADSLQRYNVEKELITSMYFSPSIWAQKYNRDQVDAIAQHAMYADSLTTTNHSIYYNPKKGQLNPLFGNGQYVKASNGVIFPVDAYTIDPSYTIMQSSTLNMTSSYNVGDAIIGGSSGKGEYTYLTEGEEGNHEESVDISMLEDKGYRYFGTESVNSSLEVFFPLRDVFSGKYRIRIQLLPNRVDKYHQWFKEQKDSLGNTVQVEVAQNTKFCASVYDDEGNQIGKTTGPITVNENKMEIVTLFESIEIPKCYYRLPTGVSDCFPVLKIEIPLNRTYQPDRRKRAPQLSVVKIFIDPVHETESGN